MEPLVYIMAILGCGESDTACREIQIVETHYASEAECVAATEAQLLRRDDIAYPSVVAQCRRADAAPQLLRGSEVMLPDPGAIPARLPRFADRGDAGRR